MNAKGEVALRKQNIMRPRRDKIFINNGGASQLKTLHTYSRGSPQVKAKFRFAINQGLRTVEDPHSYNKNVALQER